MEFRPGFARYVRGDDAFALLTQRQLQIWKPSRVYIPTRLEWRPLIGWL